MPRSTRESYVGFAVAAFTSVPLSTETRKSAVGETVFESVAPVSAAAALPTDTVPSPSKSRHRFIVNSSEIHVYTFESVICSRRPATGR
jgi:hypothetical protein